MKKFSLFVLLVLACPLASAADDLIICNIDLQPRHPSENKPFSLKFDVCSPNSVFPDVFRSASVIDGEISVELYRPLIGFSVPNCAPIETVVEGMPAGLARIHFTASDPGPFVELGVYDFRVGDNPHLFNDQFEDAECLW